MRFNTHSGLQTSHAFLSPSSYHWVNYDDQKMNKKWETHRKAVLGTELHDLAQRCIKVKIQMPTNPKTTFNLYVNDCIKYKMITEQLLYYSEYCYGTVDAIKFENNELYIFDLKTGDSKASTLQLFIYAAIFCLEYNVDPLLLDKLSTVIYQHDKKYIDNKKSNKQLVKDIMSKIVHFNKLLNTK